jgi:prophage maintenance system killer protein/predicted XRE-type DNA-binding protein
MKKKPNNCIVIYQAKNGAIELNLDKETETILLTQQQVAEVFNVQKAAISKHAKNIFESGELSKKATVSKMETVRVEGNRRISRLLEYYNLDLVISIGYRVNSKQATNFRQWATKTLREYITKGFVVNKTQIKKNYSQFLEAIDDIKKLIPAESSIDNASVLELVTVFADTWLSLDAYDKDALVTSGATKKAVALTAGQIEKALAELRSELIKKGEAVELFGRERQKEALAGILGNVMQSFGGKALYATVEERAAHLLYFIIKSHPFVDGNKRSGAFAFVWFLKKAGLLERSRITPPALTALTLFIAESNPKNKDRMVKIVLQLLKS